MAPDNSNQCQIHDWRWDGDKLTSSRHGSTAADVYRCDRCGARKEVAR